MCLWYAAFRFHGKYEHHRAQVSSFRREKIQNNEFTSKFSMLTCWSFFYYQKNCFTILFFSRFYSKKKKQTQRTIHPTNQPIHGSEFYLLIPSFFIFHATKTSTTKNHFKPINISIAFKISIPIRNAEDRMAIVVHHVNELNKWLESHKLFLFIYSAFLSPSSLLFFCLVIIIACIPVPLDSFVIRSWSSYILRAQLPHRPFIAFDPKNNFVFLLCIFSLKPHTLLHTIREEEKTIANSSHINNNSNENVDDQLTITEII